MKPCLFLPVRFCAQDEVSKEEPTKAYIWYVEESDDAVDKVMGAKVNR